MNDGTSSNILGLRGNTVGIRQDTSSSKNLPLTFAESGRSEQMLRMNNSLYFNPDTGILTVPGLAGAVAAGAVDVIDISDTLGGGSGGSGAAPLLSNFQLQASHSLLLGRVSELEDILESLLTPPT